MTDITIITMVPELILISAGDLTIVRIILLLMVLIVLIQEDVRLYDVVGSLHIMITMEIGFQGIENVGATKQYREASKIIRQNETWDTQNKF